MREKDKHRWDQLYLGSIRYVDPVPPAETKFLVRVEFVYEGRPDAFSDYRAGFEIRTVQRVQRIVVSSHHAGDDRQFRTYEFEYDNAAGNGVSLLKSVKTFGIDESLPIDEQKQELPSLEFNYTKFRPSALEGRRLVPVTGPDFPAVSLAASDLQLADVIGDGLPDLIETGATIRYWRNRGNGQFDLPRTMTDAPAGLRLSDPGVQLLDADGDGRLDLNVSTTGICGYFPLRFDGLWDRRSFRQVSVARDE